MRAADKLLDLLVDCHVVPYKTSHRLDGTTFLCFRVDDHADRYVHVEDSVESDDFVVTCRNFREVRVVVAGDALDVVTLVRAELARLSEASKTGRPSSPLTPEAGAEPDEPRAPAEVLASFAHVASVFLEDWHSGQLLAQEVCETLWNAAKTRKIVRLMEAKRLGEVSKTGR